MGSRPSPGEEGFPGSKEREEPVRRKVRAGVKNRPGEGVVGWKKEGKRLVRGVLLDAEGNPVPGIPYFLVLEVTPRTGRCQGPENPRLRKTDRKGGWVVDVPGKGWKVLRFLYSENLSFVFDLDKVNLGTRLFLPELAPLVIVCSGFGDKERWGFRAVPWERGKRRGRWTVKEKVQSRSGPVLVDYHVVGRQVLGGRDQQIYWLPGKRLMLRFWGEETVLVPKEKFVVLPDKILLSSLGFSAGIQVEIQGESGCDFTARGLILACTHGEKKGGCMAFPLRKGKGFIPSEFFSEKNRIRNEVWVLLDTGEYFHKEVESPESSGMKKISFLLGTGNKPVEMRLGRRAKGGEGIRVFLEKGNVLEELELGGPADLGSPWYSLVSGGLLRVYGDLGNWRGIWVVRKSGETFAAENTGNGKKPEGQWLKTDALGICDFGKALSVIQRDDYKVIFVKFQVEIGLFGGKRVWVTVDRTKLKGKGKIPFLPGGRDGSEHARKGGFVLPVWKKFRPKGFHVRLYVCPMGGPDYYLGYPSTVKKASSKG